MIKKFGRTVSLISPCLLSMVRRAKENHRLFVFDVHLLGMHKKAKGN